jgi:hypothetical protein
LKGVGQGAELVWGKNEARCAYLVDVSVL